MQLSSDGNWRTEPKVKKESLEIVDNGFLKGSAPEENRAVSNMTSTRQVKVNANVTTKFSFAGPRSQSKDKKTGKVQHKEKSRKAPVRLVNRISLTWFCYLNEKCTTPSCDYRHPPECVKHKTKVCCKFVERRRRSEA